MIFASQLPIPAAQNSRFFTKIGAKKSVFAPQVFD
jgi:hypothetical protein